MNIPSLTAEQAPERVVIVGAGQAGLSIATELRKLGHEGSITMIGSDPTPPYQRPPLSKAYLSGELSQEKLMLLPGQRYRDANIDCLSGVEVVEVDRRYRQARLSDDRLVSYDYLAFTTGGTNRPLMLAGANSPNVLSLRNIRDADLIRGYWKVGTRLVIIGGGFIGLEVAAVAVKQGLHVTILEAQPHVLSRVTIPQVSSFYEQVHRAAGVAVRTNVRIDRFEGSPMVAQVVLADGTYIDADLVLVGIGLIPNTSLAEAAGIECRDGILVDEFARTTDPNIVAAGDCTNHPSFYAQRRLRLESVQNAVDQGRTAAATIVGQPRPYNVVPWFWSDQYGLKLQVAGLSIGHDQFVIRGSPDKQSFSVFYFQSGRLIAADSINRMQDHLMARRLIAQRVCPDPLKISDESIHLNDLLETV